MEKVLLDTNILVVAIILFTSDGILEKYSELVRKIALN